MEENKHVSNYCFNGHEIFQQTMEMKRSQNMSNKEKTAMRLLQHNKNIDFIINDTDKNIGPACTDKEDVIKESRRQLYEKKVYNQHTQEEAEQLILVIKNDFLML